MPRRRGFDPTVFPLNGSVVGFDPTVFLLNGNVVGFDPTVFSLNGNAVGFNPTVFLLNGNMVGFDPTGLPALRTSSRFSRSSRRLCGAVEFGSSAWLFAEKGGRRPFGSGAGAL